MSNFIIVTIKDWNIRQYKKSIFNKRKNWYLITDPRRFTLKYLESINPKYIFFPHWSKRVKSKIINKYECICFHETDVPYGRGGSPIQNLIVRNHKKTKISALKMIDILDAGPVYLKKSLKLNGTAQQIYQRAAKKIFQMINLIAKKDIMPKAQKGKLVKFKRRKPKQSILPKKFKSFNQIYDHIRMLDADTYPLAHINYGNLKIEFKNAKLNKKFLSANVKIKLEKK